MNTLRLRSAIAADRLQTIINPDKKYVSYISSFDYPRWNGSLGGLISEAEYAEFLSGLESDN